ncbi:MAG TPA: TRIC cation channel family protein [Jatrophihabitantaceae bacterium]
MALDLAGIFVFALSGGLAAVRGRLDVFGVSVVAMVTAIGGGIVRDTLLGVTPPASLRHWPYLAVPAAAGIVVFFWHPQVTRLRRLMLLADAAGLALFTVTGTYKALQAGLPAAGACAVGVLSGIGGVVRDALLREIPLVLRREIYALASGVGAVLVCIGDGVDRPGAAWQVGTATAVFGLWVLAIRRHWAAPRPRWTEDQAGA